MSWLQNLDPNAVLAIATALGTYVYHRVRPAAPVRYLSLADAKKLAASVYRIELEALAAIGRRLSDFPEDVQTARASIGELAQNAAIEAVKKRAAMAGQTLSAAWLADIKLHLAGGAK